MALSSECLFFGTKCLGSWRQFSQLSDDGCEFTGETRGIVFEVGDDPRVHQLTVISLHRTAALDQHCSQATRAFAKLLHAHELVADVGIAACREFGLGKQHVGVQAGQFITQSLFGVAAGNLVARQRSEAGTQRGDLATGQEHSQGLQLGDETTMPACCLSLSLEWTELTANLAQQVLNPEQTRLRGIEASFGALLAAAELQDPCSFLDDRAPLFGTGVEHGVNLALTHDDVLLTTHAGVAE